MRLRMAQANVIGIYFDKFLSCVVGKCKYRDLVKMQPVKEFSMVTDEAFTLVVLENGWEEWIKIDPDTHFGLKNKQEDVTSARKWVVDSTPSMHGVQLNFVDGALLEYKDSMNSVRLFKTIENAMEIMMSSSTKRS